MSQNENCEFHTSPVTMCTAPAEYATTVQFTLGMYEDGPQLCEHHLTPRLVSLLGRAITVVVATKEKMRSVGGIRTD